jgi:hypothetical protein
MDFQGEQQHSHSLKTSDVYVQLYWENKVEWY